MEKIIQEIKRLATNRGWKLICEQTKTSMISFEKDFEYSSKPVRMNVYWTKDSTLKWLNLTIGTAMDHPKKGKTQLYRRKINNTEFIKLLTNPRQHTGRGYQKK